MPLLTDLTEAVATEALAIAELLDTLDATDRTADTPCSDWTVDDLAAHVATGAFRDAESFHRARLGTATPPGELTYSGDAGAGIRLSVDHLRAAFNDPPDEWPVVPTAFGPYEVADALRCLVIEFGVHRDDLRAAVGDRQSTFSPATLDALFGFGDLFLLLLAKPLETEPLTFTLSAPSATLSITWTGRRWSRGPGAPRECRIAATDDAIARLMLRRTDVSDIRFDLLDPHRLAPLFASAIRPL